jgi:hypothetical protein
MTSFEPLSDPAKLLNVNQAMVCECDGDRTAEVFAASGCSTARVPRSLCNVL